jgi:hypothetical protein
VLIVIVIVIVVLVIVVITVPVLLGFPAVFPSIPPLVISLPAALAFRVQVPPPLFGFAAVLAIPFDRSI